MAAITRRNFMKAAGIAAGATGINAASIFSSTSHSLLIKCFTPQGEPMPKDKIEPLILYTPQQDPFNRNIIRVLDGTYQCWMPQKPFCPAIPFPVTNFGETWVHVDNGGEGYTPETVPNPFHFNYEAARSRALSVRRYIEKHRKRGCPFTTQLLRRLEAAEYMVKRAGAAEEDAEKARIADTSLNDSMWAGEMAVNEKARYEIEKRGYRPEFMIGCNAFFLNSKKGDELQQIETAFERMCGIATLPFYRSGVEKEQGIYDTKNIDRILEWVKQRNIIPKGHPMIWLNRYGIPPFMKDYSYDKAYGEHKRYLQDMVTKYKNDIKIWDVINEANDVMNNGYSFEQLIELTRLGVDTIKAIDPDARTIVNVNEPFAEYAAYEAEYTTPKLTRDIQSTQTYFKELTNAGVNWDVTGIQHYWYARDMFEMDKHLDIFAQFGRPVHITELGFPSSSETPDGGKEPGRNSIHWHCTAWTEEIQADWVEQFYTICYSKPHLEALTWWDIPEGFWFNGGLLRKDFTPKPAYYRILKLQEWWKSLR